MVVRLRWLMWWWLAVVCGTGLSQTITTDTRYLRGPEGEWYGARPAPIPPIGHDGLPRRGGVGALADGELPTSYDLRTIPGKLSPIHNQGSSGSCWAFAAFGSLESFLRPGVALDFSENNLKNTHGFDYGANEGGDYLMAVAYLARMQGPVSEADDPYNPASTTSPEFPPVRWVQDVAFLPTRTSVPDTPVLDVLKRAVMRFGAVEVSIHWQSTFYNEANAAYCYSEGGFLNHAICLVGWDDTFPASKFTQAPEGDGAFLVRNSWGTGFGDGGYFWVSYYDHNLAFDEATAYDSGEPVSGCSGVYQYDPLGFVAAIGNGGHESIWGANVFTATADGILVAASTYSRYADTAYEVTVYVDPPQIPCGGTPQTVQEGVWEFGGYHTVQLDLPIALRAGQTFSVAFRQTTPGHTAPLALEFQNPSRTSKATASPGQSFKSANGDAWSDVTGLVPTGSVCIKAFTGPLPTCVLDHSVMLEGVD